MTDSAGIYSKATKTVNDCGTRDALKIAGLLGVNIIYSDDFADILGLYTCMWGEPFILVNSKLSDDMLQMVVAHELGHNAYHRGLTMMDKCDMDDALCHMKDDTEYVANAFAAHLLLDDSDVDDALLGGDISEAAKLLNVDINLLLIKMKEMERLGKHYKNEIPIEPDSLFFSHLRVNGEYK